ncbi:MAG TPA: CvpA family protein [Clostridiales bacterium]|nr:CvpA family protein [Clostridiales bacterium]
MNILDIAILAILTISVFIGIYNGFLVTVLNIIAHFASWILSFLFYPIVSKKLVANTNILERIVYYTNVSSRIADFEQKKLNILSLNTGEVKGILTDAQIPPPFNKIILTNLTDHSLVGLETLGEYIDYTIANVIINILSFLIVFLIVRLVFSIIIGIAKALKGVPVLKQLDSLLGAGLGLVRGVLLMYIVFSIIPLALTIAPVDFLIDIINSSKIASFFYKTNIITNFIRGYI